MSLDLAWVRTNKLNPDIGLTDDTADIPWGDETVRELALKEAIRRLWPRMGRLVYEDVSIVPDQDEYLLDDIWDLETLEVRGPEATVYKELANWRNWLDNGDENEVEPIKRLMLPVAWRPGHTDTLRAIGFRPYTFWTEGDPET